MNRNDLSVGALCAVLLSSATLAGCGVLATAVEQTEEARVRVAIEAICSGTMGETEAKICGELNDYLLTISQAFKPGGRYGQGWVFLDYRFGETLQRLGS